MFPLTGAAITTIPSHKARVCVCFTVRQHEQITSGSALHVCITHQSPCDQSNIRRWCIEQFTSNNLILTEQSVFHTPSFVSRSTSPSISGSIISCLRGGGGVSIRLSLPLCQIITRRQTALLQVWTVSAWEPTLSSTHAISVGIGGFIPPRNRWSDPGCLEKVFALQELKQSDSQTGNQHECSLKKCDIRKMISCAFSDLKSTH